MSHIHLMKDNIYPCQLNRLQLIFKDLLGGEKDAKKIVTGITYTAKVICAEAKISDRAMRELNCISVEMLDAIDIYGHVPSTLLGSFRDVVRAHLAIASSNILSFLDDECQESNLVELFYSVNEKISKCFSLLEKLPLGNESLFLNHGITTDKYDIADLELILGSAIYKSIEEKRFLTVAPKDFSCPYVLYEYPKEYLSQVTHSDLYDVVGVFQWIEDRLAKKIEILIGSKFRVENIWLYRTINKDKKETQNLNSNWHKDGDLEGALKVLIYLNDVNSENGPFGFEIRSSSNEAQRYLIKGEKGTTVFFRSNKLLHCAANTVSSERLTLSFLLYPSIANKNSCSFNFAKPFNALCAKNPFY